MSKQDEDAAAALVRRAGEQLDDDHWMLVGGTKSLAGRLGRATEQRVFDTEYGGHSPEVMASEYGPYDDRSIHVVIVDAEGPVAAGRVVWSPTLDLPTKLETDLGFLDGRLREYHQFQDRYGTEQFSEKATAVVERRARATSVTGWLLGELRYQQMCLNEDAPYCAMLDVRFRRMLAQWGTDFEPALGLEPFEYLNQLCQPMFFYPSINPRFRESRIYRKLSVGWFDRVSRPLSEGSFLVDIRDSIEELTPSTI
ncbi:MAG: hypothetical protein AAF567_17005 [Actinomycetota bacterium]